MRTLVQAPAPTPKTAWSSVMRRWFGKATRQLAVGDEMPTAADYQGGIVVSAGSVSAVSIADIAEVLSHEVFRVIGSTSHVVRFVGGGELRYACDDRGQVLALSATGVRSEVSEQRVVTVAALNRR